MVSTEKNEWKFETAELQAPRGEFVEKKNGEAKVENIVDSVSQRVGNTIHRAKFTAVGFLKKVDNVLLGGKIQDRIMAHEQMQKEQKLQKELRDDQLVAQYKQQYTTFSLQEIQKKLHTTRDENEARVCLGILHEMGSLRADDPDLWGVLNRLQKKIIFKEGDKNLPSEQLFEKIKIAMSTLWSEEEYRKLFPFRY